MRKILLTSAGFETGGIMTIFLGLFGKEPAELKALFIPTAAVNADAIAVLPKCMDDLLNAGIPAGHIAVFDLHRNMPYEELRAYDLVYFTGGSPQYLLGRVNDTGFRASLERYVDGGGVYVGVSAGSVIAAGNLPDNLGYITCTLSVHMKAGTACGPIDASATPHIDLTDNRAIRICGDECRVVE